MGLLGNHPFRLLHRRKMYSVDVFIYGRKSLLKFMSTIGKYIIKSTTCLEPKYHIINY